jgi:hypothetical protein
MNSQSARKLAQLVAAGAALAAVGFAAHTADVTTHIQAAPAAPMYTSPEPPPPAPPPPPPAMTYDPNEDYWTGQGSAGGAPGAGGGG